MSLVKSLFETAFTMGNELVSEARKRVKPYLPLAAELYNELATRAPVGLPKVDVDRLLDDLYPRQEVEPWDDVPMDDGFDAPAASPVTAPAPAPKVEISAPAPKAEAPKAPAPKAEAPKVEAPKVEAPKAAPAPKKVEAPKAAAPAPKKVEAPKAPAPKAEAPKAAAPAPKKAEAPKAEAPKAEAPKAVAPAPKKAEPKAADAKPKAKATRARKKKDDAQQPLIVSAPTKSDLLALTKPELVKMARERKLTLKSNATKDDIADALLR